jgi:mannose-1-phosphate guanylyltransferase/mannose-6-phosphate isomerase
VILSGGSGTRLWPVSTPNLPKQFASLIDGRSLFERTIRRLDPLREGGAPIVITGEAHIDLVRSTAARAKVAPALIIVEPAGRNTAPAAVAAALVSDPDDVLVILPSDHLIPDEDGFRDSVATAVVVASAGHIVTFGIVPTSPETGYGYIEKGESIDGGFQVARFKEKPDIEEAERIYSDGSHLWNSGIFVVTAQVLLDETARYAPDLLEGVRGSVSDPLGDVLELDDSFADVEKISFDHAVMEKTTKAAVVPLEVGWDDVGSFDALWAVSDQDEEGNVVSGDAVTLDVTGSLILATSRRVAVAGLDDVVVVETPEAVLVLPRSRSQEVRRLVEDDGTH